MQESIGFIGLGYMGHGMAKNILGKGYGLTVLGHRNREPIVDLVSRGAHETASEQALAEASDIVFLCLPGSPQVEAVVEKLSAELSGGAVIVDCSTSDPVSTTRLSQTLEERGIHLVDAPLGGTPVQAEEGTLSAMVGADDAVFERVKPVIEAWADLLADLVVEISQRTTLSQSSTIGGITDHESRFNGSVGGFRELIESAHGYFDHAGQTELFNVALRGPDGLWVRIITANLQRFQCL